MILIQKIRKNVKIRARRYSEVSEKTSEKLNIIFFPELFLNLNIAHLRIYTVVIFFNIDNFKIFSLISKEDKFILFLLCEKVNLLLLLRNGFSATLSADSLAS